MACTCGPGQECRPLKPGCWGYQNSPEVGKMIDRLVNGPLLPDGSRQEGYRLVNFHAWWGPHAATPEVRAAAVNRVLEQMDAGDLVDQPPVIARERRDIRDILKEINNAA